MDNIDYVYAVYIIHDSAPQRSLCILSQCNLFVNLAGKISR